MGRVKHTPKKNLHREENYNLFDYRPIVKKKKINTNISKSRKYFETVHSNYSNKQYYLGKIEIGITNNVFPNTYNVCRICFIECNDEEEFNSLILNMEETCCIVKGTLNIHFLKGMY